MIVPHQGKGLLAVVFGIFAAVVMNVISNKFFDDSYYQKHMWPKLATLWLAGICCFLCGWYLNQKGQAEVRQKADDRSMSFDPKFDLLKKGEAFGARHHLMFVPLQYWGLIYFAIGIFVGVRSIWE